MGSSSSKRRRETRHQGKDEDMSKGFQHNQVFKISSLVDKNVIEVVVSSSPTPPVVVKKWSNAQSQKFRALLIRPGEFRLSSLLDTSGSASWDVVPEDPVLIQSEWQEGPYQTWFAEEIYAKSRICVIRPVADGSLCLRNMGIGKQISLVKEDRKDPKQQHWKLESTY